MRATLSILKHVVQRTVAVGVFAVSIMGTALGHEQDHVDAFAALDGLRYGVSVTDLEGNVLLAHRADERFVPASNTKLFVTAAALDAEDAVTALDFGTRVLSQSKNYGPPDLILEGRGDPTIGYGGSCTVRCLETLAKSVADSGITEVGDIIGDDRWFADERKPIGWSWDDLKFGHGTAISAIAVNENILPIRVTPSNTPGGRVQTTWDDTKGSYFSLENEATTSEASAPRALRLERRLGDSTARLYGALPAGSRTLKLELGVDNPAHLAAWVFKRALEAEGVSVAGKIQTKRRPLRYADEPTSTDPANPEAELVCTAASVEQVPGAVVAVLPPASLEEVVDEINAESQNLYAEVLLRQLGRSAGTGSSFCGLLQIQEFLEKIGVPRTSYDFTDGSGLSNYNRVTPATLTALLRHAAAAPWGEAFRESLPVGGGTKGTLKYRFRRTALEGKIFAKTGTLNHADALSGYMQASSGKTLVFSIIVNDRPLDSKSAMPAIDKALLKIAERY